MNNDLVFTYHAQRRKQFRDGTLIREWRQRYPELFDEDDERVLLTESQRRYHFFEWLSAVLLFEATGYLSLVEKYTSNSHPKKREILRSVVPPNIFSWLCKNESGQPDLFSYNLATRDWFLCEVKGSGDDIRGNQINWIDRFVEALRLEGISAKGKTRNIYLREIRT